MMTPQEYLNFICDNHPCPVLSGFERAAWLYECRTTARWIANYTDTELRRQIYAIEETGKTSNTYEIIPVEKQESRVNIKKLREKEPQTFAELVHIRASDAQKILGQRTLYNLARDKIGENALAEYETVNVTDIEKAFPPQKSAGFIDVGTKIIDWAVLEIQEEKP